MSIYTTVNFFHKERYLIMSFSKNFSRVDNMVNASHTFKLSTEV